MFSQIGLRRSVAWVFTSLKLSDLELKREQKAPSNPVASNTIVNLSNILPTGFVEHFGGGPFRKIQGSCCLFSSYSIKWRSLFKERGAVVQALKQCNQDTTCITSIDNTIKFVYGHTEAFMEISRGNYITDPRGF